MGSSDVSRSKYKVKVLYNIVVLLMPDKDLHAYLANDNLNSLQSGLMTLILMIHRQYLDVWELQGRDPPNSFAFMFDSVLLSILSL
jgi:hypothetical protein